VELAPQFGDLNNVEGGFTKSLGKYQASWNLQGDGYGLSYNVPPGTLGEVVLSCLSNGEVSSIACDGQPVKTAINSQAKQKGGSHTFVVR
jgi:hypothetical protein